MGLSILPDTPQSSDSGLDDVEEVVSDGAGGVSDGTGGPPDGPGGLGGSGDDEGPGPGIEVITIEEEMETSYLDYAMSVIVSRALPDVRDGLKPVHRRILYAMHESGYDWNKQYRKSARIVGEVIGKYHPHGDQPVYDALVRMAQPFSMSLMLVDGQGNFGSVDGDPPAAMRYTESRLAKAASAMLADIDKDTVEFQLNYDDSEREPLVLPSPFPNMLVNGASGIAVGMATNVPPHNLGEVIGACIAYLDNPEITIGELMEIMPAPDFPTGALILGRAGARSTYHMGRGSIVMRGRVHTEERSRDRVALIITEIPYQVNKASMIEKIADLVRDKRLEGISDLRDESDRQGMRVVVELKREAVPEVVLNQLYRHSPLQTSFSANMLALHAGQPKLMNLRALVGAFVAFREEVVSKRTKFKLRKARERAHTLVGLAIAVANVDEVIRLIRAAPNPAAAREELVSRNWPARDVAPLVELIADPRHVVSEDGSCRLSDAQARAILELRLQRLTALGRDEIGDELKGLGTDIEEYLAILGSRDRIVDIIRSELEEARDEFAVPRRTEIIEAEFEVDDEDLIQREDMVVTVTHGGYIKRVPLATYRAQRRGGKGRTGMAMRDEDFVSRIFVANTHTPVLFFSSTGTVYRLKVWRLPQSTPQARGKAMVNILPLSEGETITSVMPLPEDEESWARLHVVFATTSGYVRRNELSDFKRINVTGKIAMKLDDGEGIVDVQTCTEDDDVLLTTRDGRCIRFPIGDVRVFKGRGSHGVRGVKLSADDTVVSMAVLRHVDIIPAEARGYLKQASALRRAASGEPEEVVSAGEDEIEENGSSEEAVITPERYVELGAREQFVLTVTEAGMGKRTSAYEYRAMGRGGKGIIAMNISARNGKVIAAFPVEASDQIMLVTDGGQLIRCPIDDVAVHSRNTQGVRIFRLGEGERVVSVEHVDEVTSDDGADGDENGDEPPADEPDNSDNSDNSAV